MNDTIIHSNSNRVLKITDLKNSKPVAKRKFHTKSRSGCNTCKRRRVKCDEGKPICAKCIHMKLECAYSNIAPGKASQKSTKKSPKSQMKSSRAQDLLNDVSGSSLSSGSPNSLSCPQSVNASNKLQNSSAGLSPLLNVLPAFNLSSNSAASANAAIQLLLANASNTLSANNNIINNHTNNNAINNDNNGNSLKYALPASSDLSTGISNFLNKGGKHEEPSDLPIEQFIPSPGVEGNNVSQLVSQPQAMNIVKLLGHSTSKLPNAQLQLLQQQQQQEQQETSSHITQNKGNILTSILSILGNSSQQNANPLGTILSLFLASSMEVPTAASLLNLANSNEIYPGLNTLASRVHEARTDSISPQERNNNVDTPLNSDSTTNAINMSSIQNENPLNNNTDGVHTQSDIPFTNSSKDNSSLLLDDDEQNSLQTNTSNISSAVTGAAAAAAESSSSPKSPSYDNNDASPKLHMLDLKLMYHYTSKVWPTITAAGISEEKLWSEYVPELAFNYPFLMHSVLAFSATHLSRTEDGLDECVYYHRGEALKLLRDAVLEISLENTDALVASAIILIMDSLANASLPSLTLSASPKSLPASAWIYHVKGAATILTAVWPLNKASRFHKFISVDLSDLGDIMNNGPDTLNATGNSLPLKNNKFYSDLKCFDPLIADLYPVEYTSPYLITLAYLDKLHNERYKSDFILRIFSFPALLDKTFLALLMTGDLAAMRIMRCYYTMLRSFTSEWKDKVWFLEGVCKVLPADVDDYSGGGGMHMMLDFLGGGLPSLSTVVGSRSTHGAGNFEMDSSGFMS